MLVFAARGVRSLRERRRGTFTVSYPHRQVRVPKGMSVLEASLRFKVPHASVCGGRARCSTCRVRIVSDRSVLPRPSGREAFVLARVGASADPRSASLASCGRKAMSPSSRFCSRISAPALCAAASDCISAKSVTSSACLWTCAVRPNFPRCGCRLTSSSSSIALSRRLQRGSPMPAAAQSVRRRWRAGIVRTRHRSATACRQALRAASLVAANVAYLNHQFATEVREPIQYGIGIHAGDVIVGDIGFRGHTVFTALGDPVNVAARLQDMTKASNCKVVVSDDVCKTAGLADGCARPQTRSRSAATTKR